MFVVCFLCLLWRKGFKKGNAKQNYDICNFCDTHEDAKTFSKNHKGDFPWLIEKKCQFHKGAQKLEIFTGVFFYVWEHKKYLKKNRMSNSLKFKRAEEKCQYLSDMYGVERNRKIASAWK